MSKEINIVSPDFKWTDKIKGAGPGGIITSSGNAEHFKTGDWRSMKPIWLKERCTQCLLCYPVCPDTSILVNEESKRVDFDYDHCKGCGICVKVCPFDAIDFVQESSNFNKGVLKMSIRERLSGNEATAVAMRQINPDVVAAFPITPSTEVPQYFSSFVSNGKINTEFVAVESEHSAMSACIGAQAAGARAMTATSANGLALMWELLYIASGSRLPIIMAVINRALSGPINIHNDHSDSMGARDSGWIQLYSENNQEAYDNMLMANRIGEHPDVLLPVMICQDGFITSHAIENIELVEDEKVKSFVGEYNPEYFLLNKDNPIAVGPLDLQAHYFEHKRQQAQGMINSKKIVQEVSADFEKLTGRRYGLFEEYKTEDADVCIVVLNSTAGTTKYVVDILREQGKKVGLIKPRLYRPFPAEEISEALSRFKAIAVMDKTDSFNAAGGPLFTDVTSAMFTKGSIEPKVINYIYGLGGRDVTVEDIISVYNRILDIAETGEVGLIYNYLGVRE